MTDHRSHHLRIQGVACLPCARQSGRRHPRSDLGRLLQLPPTRRISARSTVS